jgi:hypothetical protein
VHLDKSLMCDCGALYFFAIAVVIAQPEMKALELAMRGGIKPQVFTISKSLLIQH